MKKRIACPNCSGRGIIVAEYLNTQTSAVCPACGGRGYKKEPPTNADHIRSMTDEELANYLVQTVLQQCPCPTKDCEEICNDCILHWLKQPYKEDT